MFAECNGYVNLEQNAYIGDGKNFHFVGHGCIGKDFVCHNRVVTVHGGLIMGENVLFQGGGISSQTRMCLLAQREIFRIHH